MGAKLTLIFVKNKSIGKKNKSVFETAASEKLA